MIFKCEQKNFESIRVNLYLILKKNSNCKCAVVLCNTLNNYFVVIYMSETRSGFSISSVKISLTNLLSRKKVREMYDMAAALGKKYGKPVINNETGCLCRANPYDMIIELMDEYKMGYYLFELMIGKDVWNRVHGICYPDGTVRDPATVSALFGFYRNRGETVLPTDVNQENHVDWVIKLADKALRNNRNGITFAPGGDRSNETEELLEVCEYAANLLEAGQLVTMDVPPTAKIAAFRRQSAPCADEIKDYLCELIDTLKRACHIV